MKNENNCPKDWETKRTPGLTFPTKTESGQPRDPAQNQTQVAKTGQKSMK